MTTMTLKECRLPTGELVFGGLAGEPALESMNDWSSETASFILAFVLLMSTLWIAGG